MDPVLLTVQLPKGGIGILVMGCVARDSHICEDLI